MGKIKFISLEAEKQLVTILSDLHNLGVIIYFDKPLLNKTIVTSPQWLNRVFKIFLDHGREKIEVIFQQIYQGIRYIIQ